MNDKRSLFFQLRLSPTEKQQAQKQAQALGISLSDFYRQAAPKSSSVKLYLELGRLGCQLTQMASDLSRLSQKEVSANWGIQFIADVRSLLSLIEQIRQDLERQ